MEEHLQAEDCLVAVRKLLQDQLEVVGCSEGKHLPQILSNLQQQVEVSSDNLLLKLLPLEHYLALTQVLQQQLRQVDYLEQRCRCRIKSMQEDQYLLTNKQLANLVIIKIKCNICTQ